MFARPSQFEFANEVEAEAVFLSDTCRPRHIFDVYKRVQRSHPRSACSNSFVLTTSAGSAFREATIAA